MAQKFLTGVQLTDGSAGSPALSFSSDTNTGIYRSGDDHVNISVGGTNMFKVSSAGITSSVNVYSGTSGQFRNYAGVWKATTGVSGNGFEFTSADQTGAMTLTSNGNLQVHNNIRAKGHSTTGLSGKGMELRFFTDTDIGSILSYDRSNNAYLPIGVFGSTVSLQTNGTERLHITNAGNVGIGVTPASIGQKLRVNGNIKVGDSQKFIGGEGSDLQIQHTGTHSFITNATGDLTIANYADDRSIYFQSDNGSGGSTNYLQIDGSNVNILFSKNSLFSDGVYAYFGGASDLGIVHSGTDSFIINETGDLKIRNKANDKDIIFESDNGSGGVAEYLRLDGSAEQTKFSKDTKHIDNIRGKFGDSNDLSIYHTGSASIIDNITGTLFIRQFADDEDIRFLCDDGSGGTAEYFKLDGSAATHDGSASTSLYTNWPDKSYISLGNSHDFVLKHNGTQSMIHNYTGHLYMINYQNDGDISFQSDNGSGGITEYFRVDGGEGRIVHNVNSRYIDNTQIMIGTGGDLLLSHNGSNSYISNNTGDLYIEQLKDDGDIIFKSDNGSGGTATYITIDGGQEKTLFNKNTEHQDGIRAQFGGSGDFSIFHDGTNARIYNDTGDFYIRNNADDKDIYFQSDNGSGGVATYFYLDGSQGTTRFEKNARWQDGKLATFGDGDDLQIYHSGSHSFISAASGTGSLYIRPGTGNTVQIEDKDGNDMITASPTAVRLLYNNSEKLATTNTGVTITGNLTVSGTTTTVNQTNLDVSDNIIGLNRGASTNTNDSGIIIERGTTGDNAAILWDESNDDFVFGLTTATPSATGNVALSDFRGIKTGPITASGNLTVGADSDRLVTLGRAKVGSYVSDYAYFSHFDYGTLSNYALNQSPTGNTSINAPTGGHVQLKINNSAKVTLVGDNVGIGNASPAVTLHVSGFARANALQLTNANAQIYNIGNSSLRLGTNNTERMRIDASGNVGIGTSSPASPLHVNTGSGTQNSNTVIIDRAGSSDYSGLSFATAGTVDWSIGHNSAGNFEVFEDGQDAQTRLTVKSGGNVGIGVATPNTKLQVAGIIQSTESGNSAFYGGDYVRVFNNQNFRFRNSGGTVKANIAMSGNTYFNGGSVGIGTTSPDRLLHLYKSSGTTAIKIEAGNTSQASVDLQNSNSWFRIITNDGALRFWDQSNGAERIRINSSGNVGIGTTAPQTNTKLEVSGAIRAGGKTSWSDRDGSPLTTTGRVVAGLTGNANGNGASAMYIFTCYGGNGYQRIVYSCRNQSGTWVVNKDIDEGVGAFDVVASTPSSGSAVTFTFKGRTGNQSYTASVFIEHMGHNLDTQYVG